VLCQLSYSHHAAVARSIAPGGVRTNNSHTSARRVQRVAGYPRPAATATGRRAGQSSAAIAFAVSTSGPGSGTKTVRR
jgi:hypothetical protein